MTDTERKTLIEQLRSNQCKREDCGQCRRDTLLASELERLGTAEKRLEHLEAYIEQRYPYAENESLKAENQQLKAELEAVADRAEKAEAEVANLKSEIANLKSERDKAESQVAGMAELDRTTADTLEAMREQMRCLEACEADAKRWRECVKRGLFPMQSFGRWHVWGQGEYLTPEAAVDAASRLT